MHAALGHTALHPRSSRKVLATSAHPGGSDLTRCINLSELQLHSLFYSKMWCRCSSALKRLGSDSLEPQIFTAQKAERSAHVAGQVGTLDSRKSHRVRTAENVLGRRHPNHSKMFGAPSLLFSMETCWCSWAWSQNTHTEGLFLDECIWRETASRTPEGKGMPCPAGHGCRQSLPGP